MKITRWVAKMLGVSFVVGLLLVGISCLSLAELQRVYVIVNLDNAPVSITEFGKYIHEDDTHISSVVGYLNRSDRDIEALAVTTIYYDAFNEREDGIRGISTDILRAHQDERSAWSTYGKPSFVKTAMAFVSAVRFMDGEVWWADLNDIIGEAAKLPGLEFLSKTEMLEIEEE